MANLNEIRDRERRAAIERDREAQRLGFASWTELSAEYMRLRNALSKRAPGSFASLSELMRAQRAMDMILRTADDAEPFLRELRELQSTALPISSDAGKESRSNR